MELLASSIPDLASSPSRYLLSFQIRWFSFRSSGGESIGAAVAYGGGKAGASPRKEDDIDELGAPPELALLLVTTTARTGFLHFGIRRKRLGGGHHCLLWA